MVILVMQTCNNFKRVLKEKLHEQQITFISHIYSFLIYGF